MDFEQHAEDRQNGLTGYGGGAVRASVHVERTHANGANAQTGVAGYIAMLGERSTLSEYEVVIKDRWGGGTYKLVFPRPIAPVPGAERTITIPGPSKPLQQVEDDAVGRPQRRSFVPQPVPQPLELQEQLLEAPAPMHMQAPAPEAPASELGAPELEAPTEQSSAASPRLKIEKGMTVWVELSHDGPYKVVAPYVHPAKVPARHPHNAPNTFESVWVSDDLWLCQDSKGGIHILSAGCLTDVEPESRVAKLGGPFVSLAKAAWAKREVALWIAIAGMATKFLLLAA